MPLARDLLDDAVARLVAAAVPSPQVDAELLLAHATGRPRGLLRLSREQVTEEQAERFAGLVTERCARRPLQHLTGRAPFRHLDLAVGPGVFIPRPETELVVDAVLGHLRSAGSRATPAGGSSSGASQPADGQARQPAREADGPVLVDLCSGSGALALALATEVRSSRVLAVEVSQEAAGWLRRNVGENDSGLAAAGSAVQVVEADATVVAEPGEPLADLCGRVDVVVTNPPYVPDGAIPREPEVRDHDPALALYGGPDGLDVVRPLARQAALLLRPGGMLVVEHADVQGDDAGAAGVPAVLRGDPSWTGVRDRRDLAGLPRFTTATRAGAADQPHRPGGRMAG